jgi:hypothetical protein
MLPRASGEDERGEAFGVAEVQRKGQTKKETKYEETGRAISEMCNHVCGLQIN